MFKRSTFSKMIVLLFIGLFLSISQPAYSSIVTTVNFEANGPLTDVANFQFTILDPESVLAGDFSVVWPGDWAEMTDDSSKIVQAFSLGGSSLTTGTIGDFTEDDPVILGSWVLGNQAGTDLYEDTDFQVILTGNTYTVTAIPIPSALWLLGSGLIGIVGVRRKLVKL